MMFKNAIKLFVANFSIFWKVLLYMIISVGITTLLFLPVLPVFVDAFTQVHFGTACIEFLTKTIFVSIKDTVNNLYLLVQTLVDGFYIVLSTSIFAFVYSVILFTIVLPFILNFCSLATGESLYLYMSSLAKPNFTGTLISKIGKTSVYSILRTLMLAPLICAFLFGMYNVLALATQSLLALALLPIIIYVSFVLFASLICTSLSGWMPAIIVFNTKPCKAFKKGLKAISRRYFKILSTMIVTFVILFCSVMVFTPISLVITIPMAIVMVMMLEMVMFFESQGMRYYVDMDRIISPKKLEACDKYKKMQDII